MSFAAKRTWLVIALLLTFGAQALAAVPSSCAMVVASTEDATVMDFVTQEAVSGHAHHHTQTVQSSLHRDSVEASSAIGADVHAQCCQLGGTCSMNGCATASVVIGSSLAFVTPFPPEKIDFFGRSIASAAINSLYRPPIFR